MPKDYVPRLSIELSEQTYFRMQNRIPWGLKTKIMVVLLEDLLDLLDSHGNIILAAILDRKLGAADVIKELRGRELSSGTG